MLLLAGGMALSGWYFSDKSDSLAMEGIPATAEYFKVTRDELGEFLEGNADNATGRHSRSRENHSHLTMHYRFTSQDGETVEGSKNSMFESMEDAQSWIGQTFEVIYQESDPSVHETRRGHTNSQRDALYIIAAVFAGLWAVIPFVLAASHLFPKKKSLKQRREARQAELKQKN